MATNNPQWADEIDQQLMTNWYIEDVEAKIARQGITSPEVQARANQTTVKKKKAVEKRLAALKAEVAQLQDGAIASLEPAQLASLDFLRWRVKRGDCSDFPDQPQAVAVENLRQVAIQQQLVQGPRLVPVLTPKPAELPNR